MKTKRKITFIIILVFSLISSICIPSIKPFYNQAMNRKFIENVERNALTANIEIVQLKYTTNGNSSSIAVSVGASGVIIAREGNKYFALTANHVISELDDVDKTEILVMGYDDLDYNDTLNMPGEIKGVANYYKQFPHSVVEYSNVKYDLALISFISDEVYTVLSLAEDIPKYGDKVASMSNPYGKRNIVTAGKISSKKLWSFNDEAGKTQYQNIKHSAVISEGSSGSALLNENLEIVGINLGGNENIFHKFISGMAMPNDRIRAFLEEWKN